MPPSTAEQQLPVQDRVRIARLEKTVSVLSDTLSTLVRDMQRAGVNVNLAKFSENYVVVKKLAARQEGAGKIAVFKPATTAAAEPRTGAGGLSGAERRGEAARLAWVVDGDVVPAKELADAWGLTPQALGPAEKRGELFSVVVKRQRYYPREFLDLDREDVATVCKMLVPLDSTEKLFFWKRPHGALGGKTAHQALSAKKDGREFLKVAQLAAAHSAQARAAATA